MAQKNRTFEAGHGHTVQFQALRIGSEIRLVESSITQIQAVIKPIVFGAEDQKDKGRFVTVEPLLQEQVLLVGAIAADAAVVDIKIGISGPKLIGEPFCGIYSEAPNE